MFAPPAPVAVTRGAGRAVPGVERPVELPDAVRDLVVAVGIVGRQDLGGLRDEEVLATTRTLLVQAQRLELAATQALAEVDRRQAYRLDGAPSTARWVEGQGVPAGRGQVAVARRLGVFPQVEAAVLAGACRCRRPRSCRPL